MSLTRPITFVAAVNNRQIFEENLFASACLQAGNNHELVAQAGFASASLAYNDAMDRASNEVMVFAHQDVFFPPLWLSQLEAALAYLGNTDSQWGVLGCWGVTQKGERRGHIYSSGWGELGRPLEHPAEVQTLDEIVLILRKSSGLRFDERLRHFHLYGTDICMAAGQRGLRCYAIPAFCIHNTEQLLTLPQEFYECHRQIKRKWREHLPIHTSCIRISRFDLELYTEKLRELYIQIGRRERPRAHRVANPQRLLEELEAGIQRLSKLRT